MDKEVILYKPNLIGYFRILLILIAVFFEDNPFLILYSISIGLDYFDGKVARYFKEESKLGAALDMVTDRVSTAMICFKISKKNPKHIRTCMLYVFFDFLSHFLFFVSMIYENTHHKSFTKNPFISLYYKPWFLQIMCLGSELYFLVLYAAQKSKSENLKLIEIILKPIIYIKSIFHIFHMFIGIGQLSKVPMINK